MELLFDLILEGSIGISLNSKTPKWLRYFLAITVILFFTIVIIGLFVLGILILNKNLIAGIFIMAVSLLMVVAIITKFKNMSKEKHSKPEII